MSDVTVHNQRVTVLMIWLAFTLLMSLTFTLHACNNITPLKMRQLGMCYDGSQLKYVGCGPEPK